MESFEKNEKVDRMSMDEHDTTTIVTTHITTSLHRNEHTTTQLNTDIHSHRLPENDIYEENCINVSLLDPTRYGWMAMGGVADLSTPHEVRGCFYFVLHCRQESRHMSQSHEKIHESWCQKMNVGSCYRFFVILPLLHL